MMKLHLTTRVTGEVIDTINFQGDFDTYEDAVKNLVEYMKNDLTEGELFIESINRIDNDTFYIRFVGDDTTLDYVIHGCSLNVYLLNK